ncbi:hypothetical protein Q5752_001601 [Cryptotrichosporon argae]
MPVSPGPTMVLRVPLGTDGKPLALQKRPTPNAPFHPAADTATFRDLLLFEERLKMNAEMLRRRRRRYSVFLWTFVFALVVMTYRLFVLPPSNIVLLRGLQAAIAVVSITLALFFASGMYEEKIRYAHSYVNHSNKALRPLNMYLNLRRPRPSLLSFLPFARPPPRPGLKPRRPSTSASATIMAQIPPAANARGELIFSSRVDPAFEDGYRRYRAAFERRREEKAREGRRARKRTSWFARIRYMFDTEPAGKAVGAGTGTGMEMTPVPTPPASRLATPDPVVASPGLGAAVTGGGDSALKRKVES